MLKSSSNTNNAIGIALALLAIPCITFAFPPHDVRILAIIGFALLCTSSMLFNKSLYAMGIGLFTGLAIGISLIGFHAGSDAYANLWAIFGGVGLVLGGTCWLVSWSYKKLNPLVCWLIIPCGAVGVEYASLFVFPVTLALTQHNSMAAMSFVAPITGAWGITWLMWFGASSLALAAVAKVRWLIFAGLLIVLGSAIPNITGYDSDGVIVASVQAPDPYTAADETAKLPRFAQYVVWPEQMNAEDDKIGSVTAAKYKKYIAASFEVRADKGKPYNAARLYGPDGNLLLETRKEHRFGKEVFLYQKGNCRGPVDVGNGVRIAIPICYDLVYPDVARKLVKAGATLLLVPNSDPDSPGFAFHYIHLAIVSLRAAENSVPIAWTEINGLATIFNSGGGVVARGPKGGVASVKGFVSPGREITRYTKYGDWFAMLCLTPVLIFLILGLPTRFIHQSSSSPATGTKAEPVINDTVNNTTVNK